MRWLSKLAGGAAGDVVDAVGSTIDRFVRTADERAATETILARMAADRDRLQLEVARVEARGDFYQRNWRPTVGWSCAAALAWTFVLEPFLRFGLTTAGVEVPELPVLDWAQLQPILLGMLGLGALRTYEKTSTLNARPRRRRRRDR